MTSSPMKDSFLLIINSVLGGLGGFLFWIIASRYFEGLTIGIVTTIISISLLLSSLSEFGLGDSIKTYLPRSNSQEIANLLDSTFFIALISSIFFSSIFSSMIIFDLYLSDINNGFGISILIVMGITARSCYPIAASSLTSVMQVKPVVYTTLILHTVSISSLFFLKGHLNESEPLHILFVWTLGVLAWYISSLLFFARFFKESFPPKLRYVSGTFAQIKKLSFANLLVKLRLPVILALSSAVIFERWGPVAAAEFFFLWKASEFAMMIPNSFSIAFLVHRGHSKGRHIISGILPGLISVVFSICSLIGLAIILPLFNGIFEDIEFTSLIPWAMIILPSHVLMMNISDWRLNESYLPILLTSIGSILLFQIPLISFIKDPDHIGWYWFSSIALIAITGYFYRELSRS